MDVLAKQMAGALSHSPAGTVAVFDFQVPDGMEAVGKKLAIEFKATLLRTLLDPIDGCLSAVGHGDIRSYADLISRSKSPIP